MFQSTHWGRGECGESLVAARWDDQDNAVRNVAGVGGVGTESVIRASSKKKNAFDILCTNRM